MHNARRNPFRFATAVLALAFSLAAPLRAQGPQEASWRLMPRFGYLLPHSPKIDPQFADVTVSGVSLEYNWQTDGRKPWNQTYDYPQTGFTIHWLRTSQPATLGHAFAATVHLQKPFRRRENSFMTFKLAPGVMYATKTFESGTNEGNNFLSTQVNLVIDSHLFRHWRMSNGRRFSAGFFYTHYSNGAFHHPNLGMNILGVSAGLSLGEASEWPTSALYEGEQAFEWERGWSYEASFCVGPKRANSEDESLDAAYTLQAYASRRLSRRSGVSFGVDFFHTESVRQLADDPEANVYRAALVVGHELYVSRVSMILQVGGYVYRPEQVDRGAYWRWGLKRYFTPRFFGQFTLKAHMGKADFVEWGVGYRLGQGNSAPFPKRRL